MDNERLPAYAREVELAMARWPDVPQCFDWLGLDRRGVWRLQGDAISHARTVSFLGRHYRPDPAGRWYVQNGPQQVFVTLEYTPWVYRFDPQAGFTTHTGLAANDILTVGADDEGNLLIETGLGVGLVDDRDLGACAPSIAWRGEQATGFAWRGRELPVIAIERAAVAARWGFVQQPSPT